ncbi:23S rRNA (guanine(745)-N(1))-methyltransferase [Motilimonas eburnea]|uniref:23S rRNA (guanine(745)-N(1))-methyltransferase n=1 Tax=Motilimonas eburnea TaxID=1737488 RepID=UPI001E3B891B|nr:23S rRNA (guanine(745)-N(1))-methyltransferase [Motilimonas eburnea]MCE2571029.1 23S rRNA (guanine(745)-N(1))-methyltransferase [Motilimonas eburnea]
MLFSCPICQRPLLAQQASARCCNNHCFDFAKEGYLNLLPVQKKNSIDPGDNKAMMQARRDFLNAGHYQPLACQVSQLIQDYCVQDQATAQPWQGLDLGCGEGYYSQFFAEQSSGKIDWHGLDISKAAIRSAAKRAKTIQFCIASAFDLPFPAHSFDIITRIYAPSSASELARVIKPSGHLITVSPGPRHLFQLKQVIYQTPQLHSEQASHIEGFKRLHSQQLAQQITLSNAQDINNLLAMTPFAYKLTETQKQALTQQPLCLDLDFKIEVFALDNSQVATPA